MNNTEKISNKKKVLLLLSGGRDSFLSACRLIEDGYYIQMVTYDNGCMSNVDAAKQVADRIIKKYGSSKAVCVGVYGMASNIFRIQEAFLYSTISEINVNYPHLLPAQLNCLACRTAMYVEAIVYCKVHNVGNIAEGARETQKFFVELPEMIERYSALVRQFNLELILPVYDLENEWVRKLELADRGFVPKTFEPQCWVGCPLKNELNVDEINSLSKYYDNEIKPKINSLIAKKIKEQSFRGEPLWEDFCGDYTEI